MTLAALDHHWFEGGALRLDGVALRNQVIEGIRRTLERAGGPAVTLATVVVGDDPASISYVGLKQRAAQQAGMNAVGVTLGDDASEGDVFAALRRLNDDPDVHGILVQLPLPPGLNDDVVTDAIDPAKDVDGLSAENLGLLVRSTPRFIPCTALAVLHLLEAYGVATRGRRAVIIGRSPLVAIPLSLLLAAGDRGAAVTVVDAETPDVVDLCRSADLVISDVGRAHLVEAHWIRPGATVIDIGVSRPQGKLVGDVDTVAVAAVAGALAPNPGGAGPMTVACLLENTLAAAGLRRPA